jgi:hypothetical protein
MSLLGNETFLVERVEAGPYVDGQYVNGKTLNVGFFFGNFQPLNGREIAVTPEADRIKEQQWLRCTVELNEEDIVERALDNTRYQVQEKANWNVFKVGKHFKYRLVLIGS